ncbi:MAG: TRAP transporter substrate-binding protein DctP [Chloroflexota bacterium]
MRPTIRPARAGALLPLAALLVASATGGALAADHGGGDGTPVTLSFALTASPDTPEAQALAMFAAQVADLSNGSVTIVVPDAPLGSSLPTRMEVHELEKVQSGEFDGTFVGTRSLDELGVTAFEPLQAPFVVDRVEIAEAIAADPLASDLLAALPAVGLHGIGLVPLDTVNVVAFGPPIVAPEDLQGATIRAQPSVMSERIWSAFGMVPKDIGWETYKAGIANKTLRSSESGYKHGPYFARSGTVTGDVVFWTQVWALTLTEDRWQSLSDSQRAAIQGAYARTEEALRTGRRAAAEEAAHYCELGGRVVLAGPDELARFQAIGQAVTDALRTDPAAAATLDRIAAIKATVPAGAPVEACNGRAVASPAPSTATSVTLPPSGTYRTTLTAEDFMAVGMEADQAARNAGTLTMIIEGDRLTIYVGPVTADAITCQNQLSVQGDVVRIETVDSPRCSPGADLVRWHLDGSNLRLELVGVEPPDAQAMRDERVIIEADWERIE